MRFVIAVLIAGACPVLAALEAPPDVVPPPPVTVPVPPSIKLPPSERPVTIASARYEIAVRGLFARTTATVTFRNPNARQLEGELEFPLPDGATVCGYALDIGGRMVDGVVVGRDQGRIILESEQRRRVDPGLVEHVRGNAFRTRIFPLPAQGTRTVRVEWTAELEVQGDQAAARLPLPRTALPSLELKLDVAGGDAVPELGGFGNLALTRWSHGHVAETKLTDVTPGDDLLIRLPRLADRLVAIEERDGERFIAIAVRPVGLPPEPPAVPRRIAVAWDASGSRSADGIARGREALLALLRRWPGVVVDLVVLRDVAEASVACAGEATLAAALDRVVYDGGTALARLDLRRAALPRADDAAWILIGDGLGTIGEGLPACDDVPVHCIAAESTRDAGLLRLLAERTRGQVVDAMVLPPAEVALRIASPAPRLLHVDAADGVLGDVQIGRSRDRALVLARLLRDGEIGLVFGSGGSGSLTQRVAVRAADAAPGDVVARAWAGSLAADLAIFPDEHRERIVALGRRYGVVTPGTSLLVLESLDQHLRHRVEPPASWPELREQYLAALKRRGGAEDVAQRDHLQRLVGWWDARVAWWEGREPRPAPVGNAGPGVALRDRAGDGAASAPPPAAPAADVAAVQGAPRPEPHARRQAMGGAGFAPQAKGREDAGPVAGAIAIAAFEPDSPYLRALNAAPAAEAYAIYLRERASRRASPSFFLDCAAFFLRRDAALGARVLSNLAELRLDDAGLLRVYAWRLQQAGRLDDAVPVLRKVLRLRPEEPQSYRDLALVLAERGEAKGRAGDVEEAMELLHRVAMRRPLDRGALRESAGESAVLHQAWDRFPEIEVLALEELNRLIARVGRGGFDRTPSIPDLDQRLRRNLDTDVRVAMSWDRDATDIDLHVLEPGGEEASYGRPRTSSGGLVSRDFTQGYGPEEYLIRRAAPGEYRVRCRYYGSGANALFGPATVVATVFLDWGRPTERRQVMTLRLDQQGEAIAVGSVRIGGPGAEVATTSGGDRPMAAAGILREQVLALRTGLSRAEVESRLGAPQRVDGGGVTVLVYRLADGAAVRLGFAPELIWAREALDGAERDLLR